MMRTINVFAVVALLTSASGPLTPTPVAALTAELAKKCRDFAIKQHPPQRAGTKGYAEAERKAFQNCVARNGKDL